MHSVYAHIGLVIIIPRPVLAHPSFLGEHTMIPVPELRWTLARGMIRD